jgi:ribosomal protein S19
MDPTNKFGELTFLQLIGKNGVALPKNPFIIGKSLENCTGGPIEGARSEVQGTKYTLRIRDPSQVPKLLKMDKLIDDTEVEVIPHPNLNVCRCVISCFDLIDMEEKDILLNMISQKVIRVQRITRNENGKKVNTPALILTFGKTTFPDYVKVGVLHIATRPYFPNPMLCYSCFSYEHTRVRCPGPQRCFNCSGNPHGDEECNEAPHCRNCKGNHRPTSRQCPVYKKEVEVIKIKVRDNVTFPEARKRAELLSGNSYAQVTAQQNIIEKRLCELEATMTRKDEEIIKLREENKKKDEKMKIMSNVISQLKLQAINKETLTQSKELKPTTSITGPQTRSRNNSPVVQESKRGRPPKYTYNKPAISPDPSPPPRKKTLVPTHDLTEMEYSCEECELPETSQN